MLFDAYRSVSWSTKACQELLIIENAFLALSRDVGLGVKYQIEGVLRSTKLRAEHLAYLEKIINKQFAHQYSHFALKDSESMKTVSYLTLFFLPSTFVCALFSTSIFNFQNWHGSAAQDRVVSGAWWIFLLCCATATVATVGLWTGWRVWQHRSRQEGRGDLESWKEKVRI